MRIGQSDRRIEVQSYTTSTNAYGERVPFMVYVGNRMG